MDQNQATTTQILEGLCKAQKMPELDCSPLEESPCYDGAENASGFNGITQTMLSHLEPLYILQGWIQGGFPDRFTPDECETMRQAFFTFESEKDYAQIWMDHYQEENNPSWNYESNMGTTVEEALDYLSKHGLLEPSYFKTDLWGREVMDPEGFNSHDYSDLTYSENETRTFKEVCDCVAKAIHKDLAQQRQNFEELGNGLALFHFARIAIYHKGQKIYTSHPRHMVVSMGFSFLEGYEHLPYSRVSSSHFDDGHFPSALEECMVFLKTGKPIEVLGPMI